MNDQADKTESVVMQVLDTATALEKRMDNALSFSRGVTFSEYRLLRTLQHAKRGLTRVSIAQTLSASPSGITRALKPLEKLGYVTTIKNERDARQSLAIITDGGHELLSDAQAILADFMRELDIERFTAEQLDSLEQVLSQLKPR